MEIWFVRHAQPEWSRAGVSAMNPPLTARGERQAELLAKAVEGWSERPTELWVSPTARTLETARPIQANLALEPEVIDWHEEIRLPDWEGTPSEQVDRALKAARARSSEEWWDGLPGGESFRAFHERVTKGLVAALQKRGICRAPEGEPNLWQLPESSGRILIIGHAGSNAVAIGLLLGLPAVPWEWERFVSRHASVASLSLRTLAGGAIFSLRGFSDVRHLPEELWTH